MLWKKQLRVVIDITMTVSMPMLMAYELVGEAFHEYLGIIMFILFILHHVLNWGWIRGIAMGRYNAVRVVNLTVNLLLLLVMMLLPVSGIMISKYAFIFLNISTGAAFARTTHLLASYWGFLLMSLHIGLHWGTMCRLMRKHRTEKTTGVRKLLLHLATVVVSLYGVYAFIRRRFPAYLFLKTQFVFYDFSEPLVLVLMDYATVMVLFACGGYYLIVALRKFSCKTYRP